MTPAVFLALSLAGGLGAVARMVVDGAIASRLSGGLPWGTILINISGSLVLGLLTGCVSAQLLPAAWQLIIGTGFLGGYTTFSTASIETIRLIRTSRPLLGLVNGLGTLVTATAAAGLGLWLGAQI